MININLSLSHVEFTLTTTTGINSPISWKLPFPWMQETFTECLCASLREMKRQHKLISRFCLISDVTEGAWCTTSTWALPWWVLFLLFLLLCLKAHCLLSPNYNHFNHCSAHVIKIAFVSRTSQGSTQNIMFKLTFTK